MANMEIGSIPVSVPVSAYGDLAKAFNTFGENLINKSILDKKTATEELRYQATQERQDRLDKANAEVQKQSMLNMQQEYGARKANLAKEELTNTQLGKLIAKDLQATQGMTITNKQYEDLLNKEVSMGAKEYENALNDLNAIIKNKDFSGSAGMVTEEFLTGTDAAKILAYSDKLKAADKVEKDDKIKYLRELVKDEKNHEQAKELKKIEYGYKMKEISAQNSGKAVKGMTDSEGQNYSSDKIRTDTLVAKGVTPEYMEKYLGAVVVKDKDGKPRILSINRDKVDEYIKRDQEVLTNAKKAIAGVVTNLSKRQSTGWDAMWDSQMGANKLDSIVKSFTSLYKGDETKKYNMVLKAMQDTIKETDGYYDEDVLTRKLLENVPSKDRDAFKKTYDKDVNAVKLLNEVQAAKIQGEFLKQ